MAGVANATRPNSRLVIDMTSGLLLASGQSERTIPEVPVFTGGPRRPGTARGRAPARATPFTELREMLADLRPRRHPRVACFGGVVGRREQQPLPGESREMAGVVVYQMVGRDDALVATEHDVRRRDEREVAAEPPVLRVEGAGDVHGRRGDEHVVVRHQLAHDGLAVR